MADGPNFRDTDAAPSSAHKEYHPRAIQIHGRARFEGKTANQDDYQQWELPAYQHHGPVERPVNQVPFNASSTYSDIYKAHPLEPYLQRQPPQYKGSTAKFEAASSYAQDFVAKELPKQEAFIPRSKPPAGGKFDATTSYHDNYIAHPVQAQSPVSNHSQSAARSIPFTATTAYHDEFVPHAVQAPERHEAQHRARPTTKFEGSSTAHDDYVAHPIQVTTAARPVQRALNSVPFEGTTTNHDDFKAWPISLDRPEYSTRGAPLPHRPFTGVSTMKDDFQGWKLPVMRETLGVATVGDRLHVLIPAQKSVPAAAFQTFTTVHNNQTEMCMMIYEGSNPIASHNKLLGQFQLINLPPCPVGVPRVKVTFKLDASNVLTVEAHDLDSGRQHLWQQAEGAVLAIKYEPPPATASEKSGGITVPAEQAIAAC